ncbi:GWxTD domain-containing protein [bacterium]|nr:GWxTD domain-containing protein [bacterium]
MKRLFTLALLLTSCAFLLPAVSSAQPDMPGYARIGLPEFSLNSVSLLSPKPGMTRVLTYVEISYADLQFVRSMRGYEANYEVDLSVLTGEDENSPRYANRVWRSTVVVSDFEETSSRERHDISETDIEMPPSTYMIVATLTDLETKEKTTVKQTIRVPAYGRGGLELGDLVLAKQVRVTQDGTYEIVPNVDRTIFDSRKPIFVYYEVYPPQADSLMIFTRVVNSKGAIVTSVTQERVATLPITRHFQKIEVGNLPVGRYVIEMQVKGDGQTALKAMNFRVHLSGVPGSVRDLDTAIRQLRYIANTKAVKRMLRAEEADRETLFLDYWKEKDPSPDTQTNELMQEYYGRIERSNLLFGGFREGWETDRGEVYVRFGPPDEVERHPFEVNSKPYEIWYYYNEQRRFVFVDEMGYGEYRLVTNLWR